ncbi:hypothetical protein GX48_00552 [Paracoccidioides brasiliensis]|nr:hypothetical protein GX48_00552 [Paracoccidioides brasiliensis]
MAAPFREVSKRNSVSTTNAPSHIYNSIFFVPTAPFPQIPPKKNGRGFYHFYTSSSTTSYNKTPIPSNVPELACLRFLPLRRNHLLFHHMNKKKTPLHLESTLSSPTSDSFVNET